jgi:hypothetical protein
MVLIKIKFLGKKILKETVLNVIKKKFLNLIKQKVFCIEYSATASFSSNF